MFRIVKIILLGFYLAITASAILYTITRIRVPFLPWFFVRWSYNTMAPYQGDTDFNDDLVAEGLIGRTWHPISLDPYLPFGHGEKNVRKHLRSFQMREQHFFPDPADDGLYISKYREFATQLLAHEREKGNTYEAIRLTWVTWPRSPEGYEAMRIAPFMKEELITEVSL